MARKLKSSVPGKKIETGRQAALLKELWDAAVRLRGSIEPADYKRYVLPIIFLRFLSLRFEERRAALIALLNDPTSDYYAKDEAVRQQVLEDPDEYRQAGAFIVPPVARWDVIVEATRRDDFKMRLDDVLQAVEDAYPDKLRGLLPRVYAGSNLDVEDLRGLINIFSRDVFREGHDGDDLIGKVYGYFIGEFANSEGKRGGEYFTPPSIVRTLVAMLEPRTGVVFDPCCGSGGMFVQSDIFIGHDHQLSFVGQESKDFTYRLCRMNLFIHGLDGKIELGNSYTNDQHPTLKADYILANPPFNDGAKSSEGWGADKIPRNDPRLLIAGTRMELSPRNANTMWMMHFLHHLKDGGTAGFVMASGEMSNANELARKAVRRQLVEAGLVDSVVQLSAQLFANTQIPCSLWILSKDRDGRFANRRRDHEVLFIDARRLGSLIPGSRKQKQLSADEVEQIADAYRRFKRSDEDINVPGLCKVADLDAVGRHQYILTPGFYVESVSDEDDDTPLEERLPELVELLNEQLTAASRIEESVRQLLRGGS